ncbi:ankyrin repeat ph and sec7 domain containing protein secg-related [Anaeramoeba ignava]|uniref:Ankyrin repeat ph and sec7 domain containing protein secg-related n=1 Tax=Anaeramoeba ignava TaxID=1746090 RepID=A0A9Q0L6L7_ANAIG|nr:ankyrin repeat ph and sec7 domain containing protein secg-related [Anaeramoeba ignava]
MGQTNSKKLFIACEKNSIKNIKKLIENGIDVNLKDENEETPLHFACKNTNKNSLQIIKLLIEKGADINAKTQTYKQTPLHLICQNKNVNIFEIVKFLIEKGADINAKNFFEETPLHLICQNKNANVFEIAKFLIEKGADINARNKNEDTYLHIACQFQNENLFEIIKFFVEKGVDVNAKNHNKATPLFYVCQFLNEKTFEIIKYLISKGADINAKNSYQETLLHEICKTEQQNGKEEIKILIEIINFFLESGISINYPNNENETSLHIICKRNLSEVIELLISKGADLNAKTKKYKETPLHSACRYQHQNSLQIIKVLIENGADINATNISQEKPLHLICQYQSQKNENTFEIIKYLISKGADINDKNKEEETVLHLACQSHNRNPNQYSLEIIKFFVSQGLDIYAKNKNFQTPLSLIIDNNNPKLILFLLMHMTNSFFLKGYKFSKEILNSIVSIYSINDDLNNLLKSNDNFSDLKIQSIDSFKFQVHKLILLTRFDNNETNLQKFINICKIKPKEDVEIALNFIYTGFVDFDKFYQILKEKVEKKKQRILKKENQTEKEKKRKMLSESLLDSDPSSDFRFSRSDLEDENEKREKEKFEEKEDKLKEFFKEIGIESNWIEIKKGRKGILEDLHKLYQENETKDFTIIISEEKEIKVHKLILILRSELYKGMFLSVNDSSNQVHDYSKKSNETIQQLIHFLYHDKFDKEKEIKKEEFYDLKDYYQLNQNSIIDLILKDLN